VPAENLCRPYGTPMLFPSYPALRLTTPIRAKAARIGDPGCGCVLGYHDVALRAGFQADELHRQSHRSFL